MSKRKILNRMLGVATLAIMFGSTSVYAQSATPDASGKTPANQAGQMSPSGQNETSSVKPSTDASTSGSSGTSGTSGSSSSMGGAAATQENAAGQTPANEAGKMSPTGQNDTSSVKPSAGASASGASGTAGSSASGAAASGSVSKSDQKMMKDLAQANMAEIEAAKLAQEKGSSEEVKSFAQKMIDDHTKASDELQQLAQSKNVTLPTELDSAHKAEVKKLGALSGDKFDKKYLAQGGVSDHRKAHALLSHIEKSAKDSDLKTLASNMMPTINDHWQMAKQMRSGKASTATGTSGTTGGSKSSGSSSDTGTPAAPAASGPTGSTSSTGK